MFGRTSRDDQSRSTVKQQANTSTESHSSSFYSSIWPIRNNKDSSDFEFERPMNLQFSAHLFILIKFFLVALYVVTLV